MEVGPQLPDTVTPEAAMCAAKPSAEPAETTGTLRGWGGKG